jgi:autotransporter strand-loop-strand O-heptosyltransferase
MNLRNLNIKAHTCFIGKSGYAAHARGFFREFAKYTNLRIRNFTWDDNPDYLTPNDMEILETITLSTDDGFRDFPLANVDFFKKFLPKTFDDDFIPDVDIVLMDTDHHYFYEKYQSKIKIAYTVWESTRLPNHFFNVLVENFDYVWVVTDWHKRVLIEQGYPETRIWVVREGVDVNEFLPKENVDTNPLKFLLFGRWDYRKSIPEIINAFNNVFGDDDSVRLILNVDNPYSLDGLSSTEERLEKMGINNTNIEVLHFLDRKRYVEYICDGNVFVSCARSEGWNIPLLEAMVSGTPVIYSNYGAQLEFTKGRGIPVDMLGLSQRYGVEYPQNFDAVSGNVDGYYGSPDYVDLEIKLRYARDNYPQLKKDALSYLSDIRTMFSWDNVVKDSISFFESLTSNKLDRISGECVVIMTHADTKTKEMKLKDLNDSLHRNGYFTIISSHIPTDVVGDVNIIDFDNPVFFNDTGMSYYAYIGNSRIENKLKLNHGYAVAMLMKNGIAIAKERGYKKCHFINYDYFIRDYSTIRYHSQLLGDYDGIFYPWGNDNEYNTGFFSVNTDIFYNIMNYVGSKEIYCMLGSMCETFMYSLCSSSNLRIKLLDIPNGGELILNSEEISTLNKLYDIFYNFHKTDDGYILSFLSFGQHETSIILNIGNYKYEFILRLNDIHLLLDDEDFNSSIEIEIPCFGLNESLVKDFGNLELYNNHQPIRFKDVATINSTLKINIHNIDGLFVEVLDTKQGKFEVSIIDDDTNEIVYNAVISNNNWCKVGRKWYTNWRVVIKDLKDDKVFYNELFSLVGKRVLISFESSSLGDTLAWIPYTYEFAKKHKCKVIVSTFMNHLFKGVYDTDGLVEFVDPSSKVDNLSALYRLGWFYDGDTEMYDGTKHPCQFREQEMQKTASDILGLEYSQIRPKVVNSKVRYTNNKKYICIATHSTTQAKYWNYEGGWQKLVNMLRADGYDVMLISKERGEYMGNRPIKNVIDKSGDYPLVDRINDLRNASLFIGLGSGLSWLAWACGVPVVTISGFSYPYTEFLGDDIVRIFNNNVCGGCFNRRRLDASDWMWCPDHKNTERQFECTKTITPEYVYSEISKLLNN